MKRKRGTSEDEKKGLAFAGVTLIAMAFLNAAPLSETIVQRVQFGGPSQKPVSRCASAAQAVLLLTVGGICLDKALSDEQ